MEALYGNFITGFQSLAFCRNDGQSVGLCHGEQATAALIDDGRGEPAVGVLLQGDALEIGAAWFVFDALA